MGTITLNNTSFPGWRGRGGGGGGGGEESEFSTLNKICGLVKIFPLELDDLPVTLQFLL